MENEKHLIDYTNLLAISIPGHTGDYRFVSIVYHLFVPRACNEIIIFITHLTLFGMTIN